MSDLEVSPKQNRSRDTLQIDDYSYQERDPQCINSLCNLINSRLKLLENEILTQHKVWESIQKEVDEVKSLIEDCTSTCGSTSSSAQENDSENVDSAVESHKTCNSLYWGKIKQAEENLEAKKLLIRRLSSDVIKLKNSKKKCGRRHTKSKSSVDLILEVTHGLHVLKCEDCKFCSEHLDFREGLLSAVIELIHFTEKNYNSSLEDNKALKACLHKIYLKTKSCLLRSQIYMKSSNNHFPIEAENHTVCVDSIYTSFEEFCQHFQNLQDELLQLRQILLAAEENHLDELFQDSHSSNCLCYNFVKKGEYHLSSEADKTEAKLSKCHQKHLCGSEKKLKTLPYSDEPDEDPDTLFDSDHMFQLNENDDSVKQLENLRDRIYEAVRTIRDVEVEENDDANLVNMVTSLAEECSALRQEVSYLRTVRQEKKRSWSKLQCFIMDVERKLKGNRTTSEMKDVISELRQITSSSESSSLEETILYMYSNQLEWMEKCQTRHETPARKAETSADPNSSLNTECSDVCTQTLLWPLYESSTNEYTSETDNEKYDVGIQVEDVFDFYSSKSYNPSFSEISREIYVVPEGTEEGEVSFSSCSSDNNANDLGLLSESLNPDVVEIIESDCVKNPSDNLELKCDSFDTSCKALVPSSSTTGTFHFDIDKLVPQNSSKNFSCPPLNTSDMPFDCNKAGFWDLISDQFTFPHHSLNFSNPLHKNMLVYMFLNHSIDISRKFNNIILNLTSNNVETDEFIGSQDSSKFSILKPYNTFPIKTSKPLTFLSRQHSFVSNDNNVGKTSGNGDYGEVMCKEVIFNSSNIPVSSSSMSEILNLPNGPLCEEDLIDCPATELSPRDSDLPESEVSTDTSESKHVNDDIESKDVVVERQLKREGTFVVESAKSLGIRKPQVVDENMYYTAILTTLVSSDIKSPEKNFVIFEIRNSLNHELPGDDENLETKLEEIHSVQHFVMCESNASDKVGKHEDPADICHIIFCKSNANFKNRLFDVPSGGNSSFNPLVPQYLPPEMFNYESFEAFPLTHSCEIYTCDTKLNFEASNENDNSAFMPRNYLRFKKSMSTKEVSPYEVLDSAINMHYTPEFRDPFTLKSMENASTNTAGNWVAPEMACSCQESTEKKDIGNQTDESYKLVLQKWKEDNMPRTCETQAADDAELVDEREDSQEDVDNDEEPKYNAAQPEHVLREISLLDEIAALKENLGHQNAVLQRLKEELEDSNSKLEEKESRLQMVQMEHNRLSEIIIQSNIKEVEDKRCQTEPTSFEDNEKLKTEVVFLRTENSQNQEKITQQNKTIQHVKAQLCTSISHLKTLKDSASKQLKKQKHQIIKSFKMKHQFQEVRAAFEKKCEEIEKKKELISNQEFQLLEMQLKLDTTLEQQKAKPLDNVCNSIVIRVDNETQTHNTTEVEKKVTKKLQPVSEHDVLLKKHSEELIELHTKLQHLESIFSNKKENGRHAYEENIYKSSNDLKVPSHLKEGNIWKLLMISEQSYLSLLSKLSESLQISDLKGSVTLMHASWLNVDELADARRQDHKKILLSLDKLKRSIRYLQETHQQEQRRQNSESAGSDDKKSSFTCHTDEMHFQYLCEVLQRAQENLLKDYSQKRGSHQRTSGTPSSLRTSRLGNSRERRIPLELKNGRILALLDDKVSHKDLLPNKHDFNKIETKLGTTYKSKSSS